MLEFLHFVDQNLDSLLLMLVLGFEDFFIKLFCFKQLLVSKLGFNAKLIFVIHQKRFDIVLDDQQIIFILGFAQKLTLKYL